MNLTFEIETVDPNKDFAHQFNKIAQDFFANSDFDRLKNGMPNFEKLKITSKNVKTRKIGSKYLEISGKNGEIKSQEGVILFRQREVLKKNDDEFSDR